jgi:hypothetical protein
MRFDSLGSFLASVRDTLAKGPVCLILAEDGVELDSTLRHHLGLGFRKVVLFGPAALDLPADLAAQVIRVDHDMLADAALESVVNGCIRAAPGLWFAYCYNAEYLFFPFCEHRSIGELTAFCTEERRDHVLTYVVDLYAGDLAAHPSAVALADAQMDRSGYYALRRTNRDKSVAIRQLDFFGGLRWRFEEHIPASSRRIDRIGLFRATAGLQLRPDHTFNLPEYNTYACEWHHSPTAALCSFRTAKALRRNPGSRFDIHSFRGHNSVPFTWQSRQLLDLGLMEPGQWF